MRSFKKVYVKKSAQSYRRAISELLPMLQAAVEDASIGQAGTIGSRVNALLEAAYVSFPSILQDTDVQEAKRLVSKLRRAGCIVYRERPILAGAPGLGKRK